MRLFCLLIFLAHTGIYAASLSDYLTEDAAAELSAAGTKMITNFDGGKPVLAPDYAPLAALLRQQLNETKPNIIVESLRLYKKPQTAQTAPPARWTETERTRLYNNLLAVRTLAGIEYYSRRRGKMRTLYETSETVDAPGAKKPLPDLSFTAVKPSVSVYVRQKDLTFGDNVYFYTYIADAASITVTQKNSGTIFMGPLPVIGKNNLSSFVAIFDCGGYLLVYMASFVRAAVLPGIKQQVSESISNRAAALFEWFCARADAAFAEAK
ncbi:MAG: hypothetical protein LBG72_04490 [Spirochaetaceae bacterium]|jgi:hypothetical protein|nr:hypothetical protein [Spirochaetaceae bacterium]